LDHKTRLDEQASEVQKVFAQLEVSKFAQDESAVVDLRPKWL